MLAASRFVLTRIYWNSDTCPNTIAYIHARDLRMYSTSISASLNVATDLFRTVVLRNVPQAAAVNIQCGAHSYDAVQ
jgi:hypothetical protein